MPSYIIKTISKYYTTLLSSLYVYSNHVFNIHFELNSSVSFSTWDTSHSVSFSVLFNRNNHSLLSVHDKNFQGINIHLENNVMITLGGASGHTFLQHTHTHTYIHTYAHTHIH